MNLGIYVHIPFCVSKCLYCNFYSEPKLNLINDYVLSLVKEIKRESEKYKNFNINTIFIGGGTPSVLPAGSVSVIIGAIKKFFKVDSNCEITIESNPNSINYTNASEWFSAGVNRVSVGVQTTSNRLLKIIGRKHTYQDFISSVKTLKKVGFKNINADLMIGLPTQKQREVKQALNHCFNLGVTHISAYTLILEENTPLFNLVKNNQVQLPTEKKVLGMFNYLLKQLTLNGFVRYEVSNFAKPNFECLHNKNCWNMENYVGFGCSAHSFVNNNRFANISSIEEYINLIKNKKPVTEFSETISNEELIEETIMLNLRTKEGINLSNLKQKFNYDLLTEKQTEVNELINLGFVKLENDFLFCTADGFYVLNQIILKLVD